MRLIAVVLTICLTPLMTIAQERLQPFRDAALTADKPLDVLMVDGSIDTARAQSTPPRRAGRAMETRLQQCRGL